MTSFACEPEEMIQRVIDVQQQQFRVLRTLAEGGNGHIFLLEDRNGRRYAMKRVVVSMHQDPSVMKSAQNEVKIMKQLSSCNNVLSVVAYEVKRAGALYILLTVMDECKGTLLDFMNKHSLGIPEETLYKMIYDTCRGLYQMHSANPPIAHRDIKVENILWNQRLQCFQLCDFGSATTVAEVWRNKSKAERSNAMDDIERNTTVDYRSPEQCDLDFHDYCVNERVDLWALGCMIYHLLFYKLPFEEGSKLGIMNGTYKFPEGKSSKPKCLIKLVKKLLHLNPNKRPSAAHVLYSITEATGMPRPEEIPDEDWGTGKTKVKKEKRSKKEKNKQNGTAGGRNAEAMSATFTVDSGDAFDAFCSDQSALDTFCADAPQKSADFDEFPLSSSFSGIKIAGDDDLFGVFCPSPTVGAGVESREAVGLGAQTSNMAALATASPSSTQSQKPQDAFDIFNNGLSETVHGPATTISDSTGFETDDVFGLFSDSRGDAESMPSAPPTSSDPFSTGSFDPFSQSFDFDVPQNRSSTGASVQPRANQKEDDVDIWVGF